MAGSSRFKQCGPASAMGLKALANGDRQAARHEFNECVKTGAYIFFEYAWAKAFRAADGPRSPMARMDQVRASCLLTIPCLCVGQWADQFAGLKRDRQHVVFRPRPPRAGGEPVGEDFARTVTATAPGTISQVPLRDAGRHPAGRETNTVGTFDDERASATCRGWKPRAGQPGWATTLAIDERR